MLHEFVTTRREDLIARTRAKVAQRSAPTPTENELTSGVPLFLDQLVAVLRVASAKTKQDIQTSASNRGGELLHKGFTVAQVIRDYGDICQAITELATEVNEPITPDEFHTLNKSLDDAMAEAVTSFTAQRELRIADAETERAGAFAHELRNRLSATKLGFALLRSGAAPFGGSVAAVVESNLERMNVLIDRSLVNVRVDSNNVHNERVALHQILEEAEINGTLEAKQRGVSLSVLPVESHLSVNVDPHILSGALANLIQNALKFTRSGGHVAVVATVKDEHVVIDVVDECGGLPPGKAQELFSAFRQHSKNRSGLGLGLFISRKGVEACGGTLYVRDVPGTGCVFTIELPRAANAD